MCIIVRETWPVNVRASKGDNEKRSYFGIINIISTITLAGLLSNIRSLPSMQRGERYSKHAERVRVSSYTDRL